MNRNPHRFAKRALRLVSLLGTAVMLGCGGDGGGGSGEPLQGDAAVEASVGVTLSTLRALPQFFLVPTLQLEPQGGGLVSLHAGRLTNGAAGGPSEVDCAGGGSREIACSTDARGRTTLGITYRQCREETEGTSTRNGSFTIEALDPDLCTTGVLRDDLPFSFELSDFRSVVTDGEGAEISRLTASLHESVVPEPGGCFALDGSRTATGTLELRIPGSSIDLSLTAHELAFEISSIGTPCEQRIATNGTLDVEDRLNGERFSETFDEALFVVSDPGAVTLIAVSGEASNSCIGEVGFSSDTPIRIGAAAECPSGGAMTLALQGENKGAIRFTDSGGVEIDFGDDGVVDRSFASCRDSALRSCGR